MSGLELVFSNGEKYNYEINEAGSQWYTLDPAKGQLLKIHAATCAEVQSNEDCYIQYLQLEFSDGSKDEGSPRQSGDLLCHKIDIPTDKKIVGVYGHRESNKWFYSLGFFLANKW